VKMLILRVPGVVLGVGPTWRGRNYVVVASLPDDIATVNIDVLILNDGARGEVNSYTPSGIISS